MTLDQLRIFAVVAEQQHITRAAKILNRTQSAVSASIAALEDQHQIRLFNRVGRGIELTEAGRNFLPEAKSLLSRAEAVEITLQDLGQDALGRLRVHASQTVASYWLPPYLARLKELHPRVEIQLSVGNTGQVAKSVEEGSADIGFVEGVVDQKNLRRRAVADDQLALLVSTTHPCAGRAYVAPSDYPELRWILREPGSGTRSEFANHLAQNAMSLDDLEIAFELPSNEAILAAVAAGPYATILSRRAADWATSSGRIRQVATAIPTREFAALVHPMRHLSRAASTLLDIIDEKAMHERG
ncbi:LysR family transcriptional regulator [Oricola sp.]|uniref:LysR family transcriptional regulator n=1 Tax=Oricola sp. TaxID=1979950 RepID=UPI0025E42C75|nr:LysR family transcriptional regulator [Oricola sp.]MCI5074899.1 LysR substrate-binding domain-containing protein [Oricola sp.]